MNKITLLSVAAFLFSLSAFAQWQPVSNLAVYALNGKYFIMADDGSHIPLDDRYSPFINNNLPDTRHGNHHTRDTKPGRGRDRDNGYHHVCDRNCPFYEPRAMSNADFNNAMDAVSNSKFNSTKLSVARQIISTNPMDANQIAAMVKLIPFDSSRLELAKYAYAYCIDKQNYYRVANVMTFSSSKEELNQYISGRR